MKTCAAVLVIDTTEIGVLRMGILKSGRLVRVRVFAYVHGSGFLKHLVCYMKSLKLEEKILIGIALVEGSGSFSAVRAGVCVLNALQWTKNVKIAGFDHRAYIDESDLYADISRFSWKTARKPLVPIYQGEPHITISKKKSF